MAREFRPASEQPVPWSEIQRQRLAEGDEAALRREIWPLEELVAAQQMICSGLPIEGEHGIAARLGRSPRAVRIKLEGTGYA